MGVSQYAVLNDIHFPYESPAYAKALALMSHWPKLEGIYLNGDILEFESISSHPKSPRAYRSLLDELDYGNERFKELAKMFHGLPVTYLAGNHEYRFYRYIRDVAPEMWGLLEAPKLLGFDKRKRWRFVDYGPTQLTPIQGTRDLFVRHEPLVGGISHAKGTAEKAVVSIIYGHTHVQQAYRHKKFGPKPFSVTAYSNGWLGDITKECFNYRGTKDNWQIGFSRIDVDTKTGEYEVRFIPL